MILTRFVKKGSLLLVLSLVFVSSFFVGCSAEVQNSNSVYELYPTTNMYNFLKLNTSDGRELPRYNMASIKTKPDLNAR